MSQGGADGKGGSGKFPARQAAVTGFPRSFHLLAMVVGLAPFVPMATFLAICVVGMIVDPHGLYDRWAIAGWALLLASLLLALVQICQLAVALKEIKAHRDGQGGGSRASLASLVVGILLLNVWVGAFCFLLSRFYRS